MNSTQTLPALKRSPRILWETLLVLAVSLGLGLFFPSLKLLAILIPAAYMIIERRVRGRSWQEIGFDWRGFGANLRANLGLVLLVAVGIQAAVVFGARAFSPEFLAHVTARLPIDTGMGMALLIPLLLAPTLGEELIYRGLFQQRLSGFIPLTASIVLVSLVFALMHFSPGPLGVVLLDLGMIVVDSILYGLIFARGNNLLVAWLAHFLADVVSLGLLLLTQ